MTHGEAAMLSISKLEAARDAVLLAAIRWADTAAPEPWEAASLAGAVADYEDALMERLGDQGASPIIVGKVRMSLPAPGSRRDRRRPPGGGRRGAGLAAIGPPGDIRRRKSMPIVLRFREEGEAYERAKAVAGAMGLSMEDYLLACVAEGHNTLRKRHLPAEADLDEPTFVRWGRELKKP